MVSLTFIQRVIRIIMTFYFIALCLFVLCQKYLTSNILVVLYAFVMYRALMRLTNDNLDMYQLSFDYLTITIGLYVLWLRYQDLKKGISQ